MIDRKIISLVDEYDEKVTKEIKKTVFGIYEIENHTEEVLFLKQILEDLLDDIELLKEYKEV